MNMVVSQTKTYFYMNLLICVWVCLGVGVEGHVMYTSAKSALKNPYSFVVQTKIF